MKMDRSECLFRVFPPSPEPSDLPDGKPRRGSVKQRVTTTWSSFSLLANHVCLNPLNIENFLRSSLPSCSWSFQFVLTDSQILQVEGKYGNVCYRFLLLVPVQSSSPFRIGRTQDERSPCWTDRGEVLQRAAATDSSSYQMEPSAQWHSCCVVFPSRSRTLADLTSGEGKCGKRVTKNKLT